MNGYTSLTPTDLILNSGQLRILNTVIGITRGSLRFDPGHVLRNTEFDGKRTPVAGQDRPIGYNSTISCTLLETNPAKLAQLIPGAGSVTVGAVTTITPPPTDTFLTALDSVRALFKRPGGRIWEFRLIRAMPNWGGIEGEDASEAGIPVTFEGRVIGTDATTIAAAPYVIVEADVVQTL